jgi:hypothetical protein
LFLFVAGVGADDTNDALAFDDFAILAKFFDGCADFHKRFNASKLKLLSHQPALGQVVRRYFDRHFVSRREALRRQAVFGRDMRQKAVSVGQFDPKEQWRQCFHYPALNLDGVFAGHVKISASPSVIKTVCSK